MFDYMKMNGADVNLMCLTGISFGQRNALLLKYKVHVAHFLRFV